MGVASNYMKKREVSMPEMLLGERPISALSLITGVSGSGKSFFLANAQFAKELVVLDLDTIGAKSNGKWLTDIAKISSEADVIIGWSDNLAEAAKALRDNFEEGEPLTMYWIQPSPTIFKAANAAKAADALPKEGSWKSDWAAKAKWSDAEVEKFLSAKLELLIAKVKPEELVIVRNVDAKSPIVNGWHGVSRSANSEKATGQVKQEGARNE